jgi:hypothetical protein
VDRRLPWNVDGPDAESEVSMTNGYEVNTGEVRRLAENLERQGADLKARRVADGLRVDAGVSTGETAQAIRHLVDSAADLSKLLARMSERMVSCAEAYERADDDARAGLERLGHRRPTP